MVGANYMGGKRNAARARVRDAAGKAQRAHFGKKRLEVLRTGLSKGGSGQASTRRGKDAGPPEIPFAHARRAQQGPENRSEEARDTHTLESFVNFVPRRLSPPSSASSRSKILRSLDEESAIVQRSCAERILQLPNLLGLSTCGIRQRTKDPWTPHTPLTRRSSGNNKVQSKHPQRPSPDTSSEVHVSSPALNTQAHSASPAPFTPAFSPFIPMHFDSSPRPHVDDSGYAEFEPDSRLPKPVTTPYCLYEPARIPFFPHIPSPSPGSASSRTIDCGEAPTPHERSVSPTHFSSPGHNIYLSSPSHLKLPSLFQAQFISDVPSSDRALAMCNSSPLPASDVSGFSWSHPPSWIVDSDDVPQAGFPPSCLNDTGLPPLADDAESISSVGSGCSDSLYDPEAVVTQTYGSGHWEQVYLRDLLGELFECADPWRALDDVLGFRSMQASPPVTDLMNPLPKQNRMGVGYAEHEVELDHSTSQTLAEEMTDDDWRHILLLRNEVISGEETLALPICSPSIQHSPCTANSDHQVLVPLTASDEFNGERRSPSFLTLLASTGLVTEARSTEEDIPQEDCRLSFDHRSMLVPMGSDRRSIGDDSGGCEFVEGPSLFLFTDDDDSVLY